MVFLCKVGLHDTQQDGSLRRSCRGCKTIWYTDYFSSRASGTIVRYKVIDGNGNDLPEMKRWDRHKLDKKA